MLRNLLTVFGNGVILHVVSVIGLILPCGIFLKMKNVFNEI